MTDVRRPSPLALLALFLVFFCPAAFATDDPPTPAANAAFEAELQRLERDIAHFGSLPPRPDADFQRIEAERSSLLKRIGDLRSYGRLRGFTASGIDTRWRLAAASLLPATKAAKDGEAGTPQATLRGRLTRRDTGAPVRGSVKLMISSSSGAYYYSYSDDLGYYEIVVEPGTYLLQATPNYPDEADVLSEAFENVICWDGEYQCDLDLATPVSFVANQIRTINFGLEPRGRIEGTVRNARTQQLIEYTQVVIYDSNRYLVASGYTFEGRYSLAVGPGTYYVQARRYEQLYGQLYPDVPCDRDLYSCDYVGASLVTVVAQETVPGIDFELIAGATLIGRLVDASTQQPVSGRIEIRNDHDSYGVHTDSGGQWGIEGLAPGRWYLEASSEGFVDQVWSGHDCGPAIDDCFALADPIDVVAEGTTTGIDFQLTRLGTIAGRVVDDQYFAGIRHAEVIAYRYVVGYGLSNHRSAYTDSTGSFSLKDLAPGDYYVAARHDDYRFEAFDEVEESAFFANPLLGTTVRVATGAVTSDIDFELRRFATIEGRVVDAATGQAVTDCNVYLWRTDNPHVPVATDDYCFDDSFKLSRLEPGEYFLGAKGRYDGLAPMMLGVGTCNFSEELNLCPLAGATRIVLAQGQVRTGFELRLEKEAKLRFPMRLQYQAPYPSSAEVRLQIVDSQERVVQTHLSYLYTNVGNMEIGSLAPGDYWLMVLGAPATANQVYPNVSCGRWYCSPTQGQKLTLAAGETRDLDEIVVHPLPPYQGCQSSPTAVCLNQGRYRVEAFWLDYLDQTGLAFGSRLTDDTATFTFFSPSNIELVVKLLNACSRDLGHHFWVFAGGLTNVQVWLRVTDTLTGETKEYRNPLGTTFAPIIDTSAFATCDAAEQATAAPASIETAPSDAIEQQAVSPEIPPLPSACSSDYSGACLAGQRFRVSATYNVGMGDAYAEWRRISADAATFYFFNYDNVELLVKVLDACDVYGRFWFFATGLTDVYSTIRVEDTQTGQVAEYGGFDGAFQPIIDIETFACN